MASENILSRIRLQKLSYVLFPKTIRGVLAWASELWQHHGVYRAGIWKAVQYFLTELEFTGTDVETEDKYREMLEEDRDILAETALVGVEAVAFGQSFVSIHVLPRRMAVCQQPGCGYMLDIDAALDSPSFRWNGSTYHLEGTCPSCHRSGTFNLKDFGGDYSEREIILRWPPQYIKIECDPLTQYKEYYLNTSEFAELQEALTKGNRATIKSIPLPMLEAARNKAFFRFDRGAVYHFATPLTAYLQPKFHGWSVPRFMSDFETVLQLDLLNKYNEIVIGSYMPPMRILTPSQLLWSSSPGVDVLRGIDVSTHVLKLRAAVEKHQKDPDKVFTMPFPVQELMVGVNAKQLVPLDLIQYLEQRLLNNMAIPEALYLNKATSVAGPVINFALFERVWRPFVTELNNFLQWYVNTLARIHRLEPAKVRLAPTSLYEDPVIKQLKVELAGYGLVSKTTALRAIQCNYRTEFRRMIEEQRFSDRMLRRVEEEEEKAEIGREALRIPTPAEEMMMQEQMAVQGQMPPAFMNNPGLALSGMATPAPGGPAGVVPGSAGMSPPSVRNVDDLLAQADVLAQQLFQDPQRELKMNDLQKQNYALWAVVRARLDQLENRAGTMGRQAARQGQAPPPPPPPITA